MGIHPHCVGFRLFYLNMLETIQQQELNPLDAYKDQVYTERNDQQPALNAVK